MSALKITAIAGSSLFAISTLQYSSRTSEPGPRRFWEFAGSAPSRGAARSESWT